MGIRFSWKEVSSRDRGLTFDDVLIVPKKSEVKSRKIPSLQSQVTRKCFLDIPIVSANMDTVTESGMAIEIAALGGLGILHRFLSIDDQIIEIQKMKAAGVKTLAASVGVNGDWLDRSERLVKEGVQILTIDIAHGHSSMMIDTMKKLKDSFPDIEIIAGNVATPEGTEDLIEAGADAIKVGIGPGSMCTTRIITGCGVPQLTAIAMCAEVAIQKGVPIIADGGIRTSGDVVKALAAGASCVMLGSMLAGTLETPGDVKQGHKQYRGMASKAAQVSWRGELPEGMAPEGVSTLIPVKGRARDVVLELCGGIRSGMSYVNAVNLDEIRENALFMEMGVSGVNESHAHGLRGVQIL